MNSELIQPGTTWKGSHGQAWRINLRWLRRCLPNASPKTFAQWVVHQPTWDDQVSYWKLMLRVAKTVPRSYLIPQIPDPEHELMIVGMDPTVKVELENPRWFSETIWGVAHYHQWRGTTDEDSIAMVGALVNEAIHSDTNSLHRRDRQWWSVRIYQLLEQFLCNPRAERGRA